MVDGEMKVFAFCVGCIAAMNVVAAEDPAICDETFRYYGGTSWQPLPDSFGKLPYSLTASFSETSPNPLTSNLDIRITAIVDLGEPWVPSYNAVVASLVNKCEVRSTLVTAAPTIANGGLFMDYRIDVDIYQCGFCVFEDLSTGTCRYGKIDDFKLEFGATTTISANGDTIELRTEPRFTPPSVPESIKNYALAIGGLIGGLAGGTGGMIAGSLISATKTTEEFRTQMNRVSNAVEMIRSSNTMHVPVFDELQDLKPRLGKPTLGSAYSSAERRSQKRPTVWAYIPFEFTIPNALACQEKVVVDKYFREHENKDIDIR